MRAFRSAKEFQPTRSKYFVITNDYLLPLTILALVIALWFIVFKTSYFTIQEISCEHDFEPCQDQHVLTELEKYRGINIIKFADQKLSAKLLSGNSTLINAAVKKDLPSTLSIQLTSVAPAIALQLNGNEQTWIILDEKLRVTKVTELTPSLPILSAHSLTEVQVGQPVADETINRALELALVIARKFASVSRIELDNETITLTLKNGQRALLTTMGDTNHQLASLQSILADDTITDENITLIDVRFAQPVLKSD